MAGKKGRSVEKTPAIFAYTTADASGTRQGYSQRLVNCRAEENNQGGISSIASVNTNWFIKGTEGIANVEGLNSLDGHVLGMEPVYFYENPGTEYLAIVTTQGFYLWDGINKPENLEQGRNTRVGITDANVENPDHLPKKCYIACNGFTIIFTIPQTGQAFIYSQRDIEPVAALAGEDQGDENAQPRFPAIPGGVNDLQTHCFQSGERTTGIKFNTVTFVNGRYLLTLQNSPQFRWSGVFDDTETGSRFPANWVATSEASPDPTLNILFDGSTLVLTGRQAIELWQNNADGDPTQAFTRIPGGIINRGFVSTDASVRIGNAVYGLQADGTIWMVSGNRIDPITKSTQAQILSTPIGEERVGCGIVSANLFTFRSKGNDFLAAQTYIQADNGNESVLMPSQTLVYDLSNGLWHFRADGAVSPISGGVWSIRHTVNFRGRIYGLRYRNNGSKIVELNDCVYMDEGDPITRVATTNPILWKNLPVTLYAFELYTGLDNSQVVYFRENVDGKVFEKEIEGTVNPGGGKLNAGRCVWQGHGTNFYQARNRIIEIRYSGTNPFVIYNAYIVDRSDMEQGQGVN